MASTTTSLINYNFGGIRRKDAVFTADKITCSDCQNVELYYTKLNSGVGIRTVLGNTSITNLIPINERVIEIFESVQDSKRYFFVYTESSLKGRLYILDVNADTLTIVVDNLSVTGCACGVDFEQGWLDMFIFSNGEEIRYIYSDTETHSGWKIETDDNIHLVDTEGNTVKGLGLCVFDSRLWIFDENTVWYSKKAECRDFQFQDPNVTTSAGYISFVKPITAIYPYLGTLAVFHKDSSSLIQIDSVTNYSVGDESPGGCAGYKSLVFHGTDLYFYDDTKKGVFSFQQIVNGDKTLGNNIAYDIQDELLKIKSTELNKIKAVSVVTSDRNEVWFLVPISSDARYSIIMIFDYIRGEWVKRKCQTINTVEIINNVLYSAGRQIYKEYTTNTFDGDFIDSYYQCTTFNLGEDNTLKITKFPPRLAVDSNYLNDFFVQYVKNYDVLKPPKVKQVKAKTQKNTLIYNSGARWNDGSKYKTNSMNIIVKIPSATFRALDIRFYTENRLQDFCIKNIEFSKIKVKQI